MTMRRARRPELMDRLDADPAELARSLDDLRAVNRWLGGRRLPVRLVMEMAERLSPGPIRVLDVGTGSADIPLALVDAARGKGLPITITGLELHPETVTVATLAAADHSEVEIVQGDAVDLPFADAQFDIAMTNTTLHHFDPEQVCRILAEMDRVSRWGVVATDLARSIPAYLGARFLAITVWHGHPITRHDGPWSVRAAFTPSEIREFAAAALSGPFQVRSHPVFRLSLVMDRTLVAGRTPTVG